jgi:hypothetical protein
VGPISVELAITHSDSFVQMRLCCLKGHLLASLNSNSKMASRVFGPNRSDLLRYSIRSISIYRSSTGGRATLYISLAI